MKLICYPSNLKILFIYPSSTSVNEICYYSWIVNGARVWVHDWWGHTPKLRLSCDGGWRAWRIELCGNKWANKREHRRGEFWTRIPQHAETHPHPCLSDILKNLHRPWIDNMACTHYKTRITIILIKCV